jgi:sRNA-binding protein
MKHQATTYRLTREENENVIRMLCEHYPKTFFDEPKQRRPLKSDIEADIIKDANFAVAPEMIVAVIEWYRSHVSMAYATTMAGSKRIDLDGREVGTVTAQEALAAQQFVYEFNAAKNRQKATRSPVGILCDMHASGQISDCAVKKLEAPPMASTKTRVATTAPEFAPLWETLTAANAAVSGIGDPAMRAVVAKALIDVVIDKFRQVRSEMDLENT